MKKKRKNSMIGFMLLLLVPPIVLGGIYMISLFVEGLITRNVDQDFMFSFMETILMITFGGVLFVLFIFSILFGTMSFLPRGIKKKSELLLINDNVINMINTKKVSTQSNASNTDLAENQTQLYEDNISEVSSQVKS